MKILFTGDWHLGATTHRVIDSDGVNSRYTDVSATLQEIDNIITENGCSVVVHCGDVFHKPVPDIRSQILFYNFVKRITDYGIVFLCIKGNHDHNPVLGNKSAIKLYDYPFDSRYVIIRDEESGIVDLDFGSEAIKFYCYPYASKLNLESANKADIVVTHAHINGATVGAEPYDISNSLCLDPFIFKGPKALIAGHFHKPQSLDIPGMVVRYTGSIQKLEFGERNDEKSVLLCDFVKDKDILFKTIPLKTVRDMKQYEINANEIDTYDFEGIKDSIVKVIVKVDGDGLALMDSAKLKSKLMDLGAHNVVIRYDVIGNEDDHEPDSLNIDSDLIETFETVADKIINEYTVNMDDKARKKFFTDAIAVGKSILNEAMSENDI